MIYFIRSEAMEAVKIGYSAEPAKRLGQLQTGNPDRLVLLGSIPGEKDREAELHRIYAHRRLLGDWFLFEDTDEIRDLIADHEDEGESVLAWLRDQGTCYPEIDAMVSLAVGFTCSVYWMGVRGPGGKGTEYQVMRWDESPGPGRDFWTWHLHNARQFFPTPEHAAIRFISSHRAWQRNQGGRN